MNTKFGAQKMLVKNMVVYLNLLSLRITNTTQIGARCAWLMKHQTKMAQENWSENIDIIVPMRDIDKSIYTTYIYTYTAEDVK